MYFLNYGFTIIVFLEFIGLQELEATQGRFGGGLSPPCEIVEILRRLREVLGRLGEVFGRLGELLGLLGEVLERSRSVEERGEYD